MRIRLLAAILFLYPFISVSQGVNNDISARSVLVLDAEPAVSNTAYNTVEWACLNKKLTEKCLVYHNDQWFTFKVEEHGDYFINIASQSCRDKMGVQLIIIEGNPCEINTYHVLECIRRIQQGITYVALKDLKAGASYLVNVDGFEGDFCEFKIQLSSTPWKPVTPKSIEDAEAAAKRKNKVIELSWDLKDEVKKTLSGFNVYKEREGSHQKVLVREMGVGLNAFGANASKYTMTDTLPAPGVYKFEIFGLVADSTPLVAKYDVTWDGVNVRYRPPLPPKTIAVFPLAAQSGAPIELVMYNQENADRLWKRTLVYDPAKHATMQIELEPWLKEGLKKFLVVVIDEAQREPLELYFTTDRNGNVVRE
jgi:hypothetical protein